MEDSSRNNEAGGEYGRTLFAWQIPEYEKHERGRNWYIIAVGSALFLLFFAIITLNFLFALIIAAASYILVMHHSQEPAILDVRITEEGIQVGSRFYPHDSIKDFAIVYQPRHGVKQLYLEFKSWYMHRLSLPLLDLNPIHIRQALLDFLAEDSEREEPPLTESLARLLKL